MKRASITPKFVEFIPRELEDGVLYVAFEHLTATHLCCCGCGSKVVMSLRPTDHSLTVVGNGVVSIWPSVGNWDFPCRSDYIIDRNLVVWAAPMRDADIRRAFRADEAMRIATSRNCGVAMCGGAKRPQRSPGGSERNGDRPQRQYGATPWMTLTRKGDAIDEPLDVSL